MLCMQCREGPCAEACPTGAIHIDKSGIILIDEELCTCGDVKPCIGTCPFGALSVNRGKMAYFPDYLTPDEQVLYATHRGGAVEKCDLCYHRISAGREPACVQSCPSGAMIFGDLDDEQSDLAQLVSRAKAKLLREDLDLDPSVFYVRR
jgi:molybdopterin-containing oxidoreductase family iron-sulfur binding subunit